VVSTGIRPSSIRNGLRERVQSATESGNLDGVADRLTKSERTRGRILDAAADVLAERGYAAARLSDIAERAGIKTGSLYYHFESREALVAEVLRIGIRTAWDHVALAIGRLPSSASPLDRLSVAIRAHTTAVVGLDRYVSAQARTVNQLPAGLASEHREDQRAYGAYWDDLFRAAQAAGQVDPATDLFAARMMAFGAMNWTVEWFRERDDASITRLADEAVRVLVHGIGADTVPVAAAS
jgi:AcrR family transcriptional regulator